MGHCRSTITAHKETCHGTTSERAVSGKSGNDVPAAYVTLILDETGSMQDCKGAAIAGVNQYFKTLRQMPARGRLTLTLFNSGKLEVRHRNKSVALVPELTAQTYQPAEGTPLYDAIGRTLAAAGKEALQETKKLCVILTDGLENASREYTRDGISRMIKEYERQGWIFVYLGADHDAWAAGGDLGIAGDNTVQFCRRDTGQVFDRLAEATSTFLCADSARPGQGFWKNTGKGSQKRSETNTPNGE
ncbi:MAG: VWA domain-containing protein [Nitrospira sp.]|nr:VWA domain-containing protein [Nitrospira sp.]